MAFSCAILLGAGMPALQYSVGVRFYLLRFSFEMGHSKHHTTLISDKKVFKVLKVLFKQITDTNHFGLITAMKLLSIGTLEILEKYDL